MANNKISYELCAAAEAAENGVRRTWSPEQYREYAAKLDRLVEEDRIINQYFCSIGMVCPIEVVEALSQQTAALREIELPKEK